MDNKALAEYLDQTRWLLNNGLINDGVKNQLFVYGSIVHKNIEAVEVDINVEKKIIEYKVYVNKTLINLIEKYKKLSQSTTMWGMWRFKRLLKKEGNLNFNQILNAFVRDYCGPKWSSTVEVRDIANYVEGYGQDKVLPSESVNQRFD